MTAEVTKLEAWNSQRGNAFFHKNLKKKAFFSWRKLCYARQVLQRTLRKTMQTMYEDERKEILSTHFKGWLGSVNRMKILLEKIEEINEQKKFEMLQVSSSFLSLQKMFVVRICSPRG